MCAGSRNGPVISVNELQMVREMVVRAIGAGEIEGGCRRESWLDFLVESVNTLSSPKGRFSMRIDDRHGAPTESRAHPMRACGPA